MARLVAPHYPHHVTQRGNRRWKVFFSDSDYILYKQLLAVLARNLLPRPWHIV